MAAKKDIIPNRFECNKRIWNKLSNTGKLEYNTVREIKAREFVHPKSVTKLTAPEWDTISHNMACQVAWAVEKRLKEAAMKITL